MAAAAMAVVMTVAEATVAVAMAVEATVAAAMAAVIMWRRQRWK